MLHQRTALFCTRDDAEDTRATVQYQPTVGVKLGSLVDRKFQY